MTLYSKSVCVCVRSVTAQSTIGLPEPVNILGILTEFSTMLLTAFLEFIIVEEGKS